MKTTAEQRASWRAAMEVEAFGLCPAGTLDLLDDLAEALAEVARLRAIEAAARAHWAVTNLSADLRPDGLESAARDALREALGGDPEAEDELRTAGVGS